MTTNVACFPSLVSGLLISTALGMACSPSVPVRSLSTEGSIRQQPKTIVIATDAEPNGLGGMFTGQRSGSEHIEHALHRSLSELNDTGAPIPGVVARLPSLDDGTWRLLPDGRAETTWELRPEAKWHDGVPLTVDDVILGWRMFTAPDVPIRNRGS